MAVFLPSLPGCKSHQCDAILYSNRQLFLCPLWLCRYLVNGEIS